MTHRIHITGCLLVVACTGGWTTAAAVEKGKPALDTMPASRGIPALTQQLLSALPSDSTVWLRYMSDRGVYVSEAGEVASKRELLDGFAPFPQGLAGSIEVQNPKVTDFGDVAIFVFDAHEKQTVYDQKIEVNYRSTQTWHREKGQWRLIAAQSLVLAKDPPPLPISTGGLADFAGTYELSGTRRYRVEQRGDSLLGGREGGQLTPLIAVGDNVFADAGSNLGILRIFVRGPAGAVERMVQRRKFADLNWVRVPEGATEEKPKK